MDTKKASDIVYLRIMLEARLKSWEESLRSWEGMPMQSVHSETIANRRGRVEELKEVLRLLPDVSPPPE